MSSLHRALMTLGPVDFNNICLDDLESFLSDAFSNGQLIVDSVPMPASPSELKPEGRSRSSSLASSTSEIALSCPRSARPHPDVELLQKEWKPVKLNASDNLLGMNVYKLNGKDGKGSWFSRRSVHEGLGFRKWKKAFENEFPETLKIQGGPGEGNIRGIGGESKFEHRSTKAGGMEVYLLSAQFPGPTTPRDFVTMVLTSAGEEQDVSRQFMVVSRPLINHPDTPPRKGFIRGQYESVEFIREIPASRMFRKSGSTTKLSSEERRRSPTLGLELTLRNAQQLGQNDLPTSEIGFSERDERVCGRIRGNTISFDSSTNLDAKEDLDVKLRGDMETNPIEWIMVTRSDPGGSVPRFMIERGTPSGIVIDARKFLDWAYEQDFEEHALSEGSRKALENHSLKAGLNDCETNSHLAGIEQALTPTEDRENSAEGDGVDCTGDMVAHAPMVMPVQPPTSVNDNSSRRASESTISGISSVGTFTSALERYEVSKNNNACSTLTVESNHENHATVTNDKELRKFAEKKRKLDSQLQRERERELSKGSDKAREASALRRIEENHAKRHEKIERQQAKKNRKAIAKRQKAVARNARTNQQHELDNTLAENARLKQQSALLKIQVGDLQAANTALVARVGRLGATGEEVLRDWTASAGSVSVSSSGSGGSIGDKAGFGI